MCMEDIRIGRETAAEQQSPGIGVASAEVVPFDSQRVALILCPPATQTVTLSFKIPAVAGEGIIIPVGGAPVVLDVQKHGRLVWGPWNGIAAALNTAWSFIESTLTKV